MRAYYRRPTGKKAPGYDTPEHEQIIADTIAAATATPGQPCPFCGGEPEARLLWALNFAADISIRCSVCGCQTEHYPVGQMVSGTVYSVADRVKQAAAIWNRRAGEAQKLCATPAETAAGRKRRKNPVSEISN